MKNLKYDAIIFTLVLIVLVVVTTLNYVHGQKVDKEISGLQNTVYSQNKPVPSVAPSVTATPSATVAPTVALFRPAVKKEVTPVSVVK